MFAAIVSKIEFHLSTLSRKLYKIMYLAQIYEVC